MKLYFEHNHKSFWVDSPTKLVFDFSRLKRGYSNYRLFYSSSKARNFIEGRKDLKDLKLCQQDSSLLAIHFELGSIMPEKFYSPSGLISAAKLTCLFKGVGVTEIT